MISDYRSWYDQNEEFLNHLFNHNSIIFYRINDILSVMDFIANHLEPKEVDEDLELIFDAGFSYLFNRVKEIKLYLENNFNNDLHKLLDFEDILNYVFYVDDLKDALIEKDLYTDTIKKELDLIGEKITDIVDKKKKFTYDDIEEYDAIILSVVPKDKEILTVPEIFSRITEELMIN
ncbi:MAG: hypothetical protein WDA47_02690 [Bacilli bacterium]